MTHKGTGLRLRTTRDLLVAVPYLLGFQPHDSAVLVGVAGHRVVFAARTDLPPPDDPANLHRCVRHLAEVAQRQPAAEVIAIGYGPPPRVDPAAVELQVAVEEAGIQVRDALRVTGARYWSYLCEGCCPDDGTPLDLASSEIAAAATLNGLAVLPDRAAFEQQVEPLTGVAREAMTAATERAEVRVRHALGSADKVAVRRLLHRRGDRLLDAAPVRYAEGGQLSDDEAAWLSVLLLRTDFAEQVWHRMVEHPSGAYLPVWQDLVRRVQPDLCAPVATLLGYAAWRAGDGALAGLAVRRALRESPGYEPAQVLHVVLFSGVRPAELTATLLARRSRKPAP